MTRLPRVSGKEVVRALQKADFEISHVRGSHYYLRRPDQNFLVTVPVHGNHVIPVGILAAILKQAHISAEELEVLLAD